MSPKLRAAIAALLIALAGVLTAYQASDDRSSAPPPRTAVSGPQGASTVTIPVDGADADTRADDELVLDAAAVDVANDAAAAPEQFDVAGDLRGFDTSAAGVLEGPLAAQEWPGCKTAFHKSFSSRQGARILAIALHYTAGGNRPGWADVDGLTAYSANRAREVSWHFAIDREGHCAYNVPLAYKSWAIGNLNREVVNFEIVGTGQDKDYVGAGWAKFSKVARRAARLHNIPIRLGAVRDCRVIKTGFITHWQGGQCSGAHHDIRPYAIEAVIRRLQRDEEHDQVHRDLRRLGCSSARRRAKHPAACGRLERRNRALHRA
jgi:hypothetical protein